MSKRTERNNRVGSAPRSVPDRPVAPSPFAGMQARLGKMIGHQVKAVQKKRKESTYGPPPPKRKRYENWVKGQEGQR